MAWLMKRFLFSFVADISLKPGHREEEVKAKVENGFNMICTYTFTVFNDLLDELIRVRMC